MARVLLLTDSSPDYGADFLYDGFASWLGPAAVWDWPAKPSLHGGEPTDFDCSLVWRQSTPGDREVLDRLAELDLIVIPSLRTGVRRTLLARAAELRQSGVPVVAVDCEDHAQNLRPAYEDLLGARVVAYLKRELPVGENWAHPFPLCYPARRCVPLGQREAKVAFLLHLWDGHQWAENRALRQKLARLCKELPADLVDAHFSRSAEDRLSLSEYHARTQRCVAACVPAGAGYFTNRLFEVIADGCAPILEQPWVTFPFAPQPEVECLHFREAGEVRDICLRVRENPEEFAEMARAARQWFLRYHTAEMRARAIYEAAGLDSPVPL